MKESFVLELFQNIAVLISFVFLYDLYWVNKEGEKKFPEKIVAGLMIGIVGVIVIMTSWHLTAGVLVNSCTILLSLAGLAFGVVPTCVATLGLILFRYSIGGAGVWIGISLILSSGLIGLLWRYFRPGWQNGKPVRELALMASTVYLCVIVNMLLLMPEGFSFRMLDEVMLFLFLVYIPFTVVIGVFMKKRAESWVNKKMLLESQSLYASLVENIPAGVFRKSKAGHFVFVNQRFCELQGLKREQIIGKNLAELFEQKTRNISLTPWKDKWLQLSEHSMTDHHQWILKNRNSVMVDENFLKSDGEIGFLHVIKSPVFDENGQPIGSQGIQVDVTEQKKLESDLRLDQRKSGGK